GVSFAESQVPHYLAEGPRGLDPTLALAVFPGAASCNIAIEFGFTGPNATNAMSCASGTIAVGEAFHVVRDGRAGMMLAGGGGGTGGWGGGGRRRLRRSRSRHSASFAR